jgi:MFS transporter, DHA2 family, multidrug resistance protein
MGIALSTTLLARRSQFHQSTLSTHVTVWSPDTASRLKQWGEHFLAQGADSFTAQRRALAMLYRDMQGQAQVLAYGDVYALLVALFVGLLFLIPWMHRVRAEHTGPEPSEAKGRVDPLPEPVGE